MNIITTLSMAAAVLALGTAGSTATAQSTAEAGKAAATKTADTGAADLSDAEVRKIDKEQGKVTLKHGPIKSLDMPPMTMVFSVRDKAMLDAVKTGDKVRFKAVNDNGRMTVVEMAPAR